MKQFKLFIVIIGSILPLLTMAEKINYVIEGKIGRLSAPAKAYLIIGDHTDSAILMNGSFTFKGVTSKQTGAFLMINKKGTGLLAGQMGAMPYRLSFYIEPGVIKIFSPDSINNARVVAGPLNADYVRLRAQLSITDAALASLSKYITSASSEVSNTDTFRTNFEKRLAAIGEAQKKVFLRFMNDHPGSLMSLLVLKCYGGYDYSMLYNNNNHLPGPDELDSLLNLLTADVRTSSLGAEFKTTIDRVKRTQIGFAATDFTQPDTSGKKISLHELKGKYVLIDFWASWCGPCRAENPTVVKAFNKYRSKGFTVLGVSLDYSNGRSAWLKAIHDDGLTWTHVSDLKGWNNEAARLYGVLAVPQNYLIDPDGRIVGKGLRGEDLEKRLGELIGAAQPMNFELKGKIGELSSPSQAFLMYDQDGSIHQDSTVIDRGSFTLHGTTVKQYDKTFLVISKSGKRSGTNDMSFIDFYTDSPVISIHSADSLSNSIVTGGQLNRDDAALKADLARAGIQFPAEDNSAASGIVLEFLRSHPNSMVSLRALMTLGGDNPDPAAIEPTFNSLSRELRETKIGMDYAARIAALKTVAIGRPAPDFTLYDTLGKPVSLHDLKGKYVLLDFWASWCPPCRAENPNVVAAYTKYKKKNFTVLGVTLDNPNAKAAWLKAIHEDGLKWTHVSSKEMYDNIAATLYSVKSIPRNFLISPDGKIIAKNLREEGLQEKLREVLGE